jgi:transcriptional regulator with XRE-family HTH domain
VQIRTLRKARGWSLAELARKVGSSAPTIHRYESGWDRFEMATLKKIAAAFGARLDVNLVERSTPSGEATTPSSGRLLKLLSPLFWDRKLQAADLQRYQGWVLERVLAFGDWRQVVAARQFFGDEAVAQATERRGVDGRTRNFWKTILKGDALASEST